VDQQTRSWRKVPAIAGAVLATVGIALLENITAGAIDPDKAPALIHWGWFAFAVYLPLYIAYVSPMWGWLANSWHRSSSKILRVLMYAAIIGAYLLIANAGIVAAWRNLAPRPTVATFPKQSTLPQTPGSSSLSSPPLKQPHSTPEVVIRAPEDYIYNLTWIPGVELAPRVTLGSNYDQPFLEIRKVPMWPTVPVTAVTVTWSIKGDDTKSLFLKSGYFAKFNPSVTGDMLELSAAGKSGISMGVTDHCDVPLDYVGEDPSKMVIPPLFWNGFILRFIATQKRPAKNGPMEGFWRERATVGLVSVRFRSANKWFTRRFRVDVFVQTQPDSVLYSGFTVKSVPSEVRSDENLRACLRFVVTQY
jgi:hypothetical protein